MPQWLGTVLTWIGAFAALLISGGIVNLVVQHFWIEPRRKKELETERRKERASRLRLFALEAVELQERFVQYVRQVFERVISGSTPFELTTSEQVNELIKLGAGDDVIQAIYHVKELANDVRRNVALAQEASNCAVPEGAYAPDPQGKFNSAAAFIRDRWDRVRAAITVILDASAAHGCEVGTLRKNFAAQTEEYEQKYRPYLRSSEDPEPPKKDPVPQPSK